MLEDGEHIRHPGEIEIRVVYHDDDLIELETHIRVNDWCGVGRAYTSADDIRDKANGLVSWSHNPSQEFLIEAGADTGIGWLVLRFYIVDMAGHVACHVTLASPAYDRTQPVWRLALSIPSKPGLIERFAKELLAISEILQGKAILEGVQP